MKAGDSPNERVRLELANLAALAWSEVCTTAAEPQTAAAELLHGLIQENPLRAEIEEFLILTGVRDAIRIACTRTRRLIENDRANEIEVVDKTHTTGKPRKGSSLEERVAAIYRGATQAGEYARIATAYDWPLPFVGKMLGDATKADLIISRDRCAGMAASYKSMAAFLSKVISLKRDEGALRDDIPLEKLQALFKQMKHEDQTHERDTTRIGGKRSGTHPGRGDSTPAY